jgi:membrane protein DedA with SNARE-associated domain
MSSVVLGLGPLGVFLLMVPESACIPIPSEVTLMCAGFAEREFGPRPRRALAGCDRLFERHGARAVFFARLLPLARTFISLPAGYARIRLAPFTAMTAVGCAIWAAVFVLLGLLAGRSWSHPSDRLGLWLLLAVALAGGARLLRQRRKRLAALTRSTAPRA